MANPLGMMAAPILPGRVPRWVGGFIVVYTSGEWEFYRCCNCERRLSDRTSRSRGYGSECAKLAHIAEVVEAAMSRDRTRMRLDLAARRARARHAAARRHV